MSFNNGKVNDFLEKLQANLPKKRDASLMNQRKLPVTYLNFKNNLGRYQVLPCDSVITDFPYAVLNNTYEVNVKRRSKAADGSEVVNDAYIKLFHPDSDMYKMKDMTGRVVSSLTQSDLDLITQARGLFEELWEELDGRNNREEYVTSLLRKRNYTIFYGYCLNFWANDSRTPTKSNFSTLFVVTSKQFLPTVYANIEEKTAMEGGETGWLANIYNRQASGRDGFLVFSVTNDPSRVGYLVTSSHEFGRSKQLENVVIPEEDMELMVNPCTTFLGWQAPKGIEDENPMNARLFNPQLYREAVNFLSEQLAAVRTAKSLGTDIAEAIQNITNKTLAAQPVRGSQTNDPVLAGQQAKADFNPNVGANPQRVVENTTAETVFTSPAAAQLDPVSGMPVGNDKPASNPFGEPAQTGAPASGTTPFGGGSPFGGFGQPNFGSGGFGK